MEPVILEALTKGFETLKEKYPETDFQAVLETTVELYTAGKIVVEIIKAISKKFGIRKEDLEPVFVHIGTKSAGEPTDSVKVEVVDANPKVKIEDIVFCLTPSDKEKSYWVCREVATIDPGGQVTEVRSVDDTETTSIHLFLEYKIPKQRPFLREFARYLQKAHRGKGSIVPEYDLDQIIAALFTPGISAHPEYIQCRKIAKS